MRTTPIVFIAALLLLNLPTLSIAQSDTAAVEKLLLNLERNWAAAIEKRDGKAIEPLLASNFISIEPDGALLNKAQYIEARVKDPVVIESSTLEKMEVRLYGETATVTGLQTNRGKVEGKILIERFRYVDVFVLSNGTWKCISTQVTPLPGKK